MPADIKYTAGQSFGVRFCNVFESLMLIKLHLFDEKKKKKTVPIIF